MGRGADHTCMSAFTVYSLFHLVALFLCFLVLVYENREKQNLLAGSEYDFFGVQMSRG